MQDDARDGVHHRRKRANGDHVARRFDGALLGVLVDLLQPLRVGCRPDVAELLQNRVGIVFEQRGQLRVAIPRANNGRLVDVERFTIERRHEGARLLQLDVALARLLRVVERIGVQERPDELSRHVLETKLEVRVLIDRVVARIERQPADEIALRFGDFRRRNHAR